MSWDVSIPAGIAYLDGVQLPVSHVPPPYPEYAGSMAAVAYSLSPTWWMGGARPVEGSPGPVDDALTGHISEFYLNLADHDFVAALTPALIDRFRTNAGQAREIGATASFPFGPKVTLKPDFYLTGQLDEFVNSFAKSTATLGHRWSVNSSGGFAFSVVGGPLDPSETDPFAAQEVVT